VGIYFQKTDVLLDTLMNLPDSKSSDVIKEIDRFWTLEPKFREYGFMWKRGVLLWGPPGSGKTSTLQLISKSIVDRGGLAIYVTNPHVACKGLQTLRSVEKQRPIVVMIEDIDAVLAEYGESELLALMDGELQIDNIVFVATTNYPELLDKRFVNRPSRFDIIRKIGMPSDDARRSYLSVKNSRLVENKTELEEWVAKSKNFSIAHLKELIIAVEILGQPIDFACARLHKMSENLSSSNSDAAAFGFANKG
jgi:ATP-dependent 26S proteasome regulatory subunit